MKNPYNQKYYDAHKEEYRERTRAWVKANPEKNRLSKLKYERKRQARLKQDSQALAEVKQLIRELIAWRDSPAADGELARILDKLEGYIKEEQ